MKGKQMDHEFDITDHVYFPSHRESKIDRTLRYLSAFAAGMGFLAALIILGVWLAP